MSRGDRVVVYPFNDPDQSAVGKITYLGNGHPSIAIAFKFKPSFGGFSVVLDHKTGEPYPPTLWAMRKRGTTGEPVGPWKSINDGAAYLILLDEIARP